MIVHSSGRTNDYDSGGSCADSSHPVMGQHVTSSQLSGENHYHLGLFYKSL